jgi:flagellar motor switch protein FliN/FliY
MTAGTAQAQQNTFLHELAAELAPSPEEFAAALNPAPGQSETAKPGDDAQALARTLGTIMRIPVSVKIVLGSATMPVANLVKLGRGAIIPLDRKVGEPVDVVVNGRVVARGEVVVVDEATSRFGISLTEVVGQADKDKFNAGLPTP